jgi:adenosylmethionine-8-amino-7-oxononanoate aminotransferase
MKSAIWKPFTIQGSSSESLRVTSGSGLYLTLEDGRKIKDMISSWWVNIHGHSHPYIANEISKQAHVLEHVIFADYTHDPAEKLARALLDINGGVFEKVFFSDNGSTAVEVALKVSLQYWMNQGIQKRNRIIAFEGAYHGDTFGAMSAGERSVFNAVFENWMFSVERIPYPSTWINDPDILQKERDALAALALKLDADPFSYAALIIEPLIQGAGGMRMCSARFIDEVVKLAKSYGVLVIFDEVMTGFGRTGTMFAYQQASVQPDMMCLSKGLTGGFMPLSVTLMTGAVFEPFNSVDALKTFWHGHSYTANPLGCAAALASISLFDQGITRYQHIQNWHESKAASLMDIACVRKMRICGTIMAFDVETNGDHSGYLNQIGKRIKQVGLQRGMLLRPLGNVVYLMPPYCIQQEELNEVYDDLAELLEQI